MQTDRLTLRQLTHDDADFIIALLNDADFIRFIRDAGVRTREDACVYVDGVNKSHAQHGHGLLRVALQDGDVPIGICGVLKRDTLPLADLGFAFLPAHRGKGFAVEAATAVLADASERLRLPKVLAIASPDNERSVHLLTKLGFAFVREQVLSEGASAVKVFERAHSSE